MSKVKVIIEIDGERKFAEEVSGVQVLGCRHDQSVYTFAGRLKIDDIKAMSKSYGAGIFGILKKMCTVEDDAVLKSGIIDFVLIPIVDGLIAAAEGSIKPFMDRDEDDEISRAVQKLIDEILNEDKE